MNHTTATSETNGSDHPLSFLWLELTNRCNLRCRHCYAESGPHAGDQDLLGRSDYLRLIGEAAKLGCKQIQFIGGEPTLNRDLSYLIERAVEKDYSFIEVFSNLTRLPEGLIACLRKNSVYVATSVYSAKPETHDVITGTKGSFRKTIATLRALLDANIPVRAGIIEMEANSGESAATMQFLNAIGVRSVRVDRLRHFGRGAAQVEQSQMTELCGSCAGGTMCVGPDGRVSPCIMSKNWSVGSCRDTPLALLANGERLQEVRNQIRTAVVVPRENSEGVQAQCDPQKPCFPCGPDTQCKPCPPNTNCPPNSCRPYCMPN
jgi:sulfatase maturation enzyme AslB (radical SAM superfamily)